MTAPVKGGGFEGLRLKGKVFPGGGDWLLLRPKGVGELVVRGIMQSDDGALIYGSYRGSLTKILGMFPRWVAGEHIPHEEYDFAATP